MPTSSRQPLVSVVITTFNRPRYLKEALASAVGQSYTNLEIIVSDNHSGPEAFAEIKEVVEAFQDPRITLQRRPENVGLQHNNVWALRDANGAYVANLHDDDIWEVDFAERMVAVLEAHPEATMAFCDHYLIDSSGTILQEQTEANTAHWKRSALPEGLHRPFARIGLIDRSIPGVMGAMYRHDAIAWAEIPEPATAYDLWLIYLACRDGQPAYYIDDRLTRYRVHDQSQTSRGLLRLHHDLAYCYEQFAQDDRLAFIQHDLLRMASLYHGSIGAAYLKADQPNRARHHFARALELSYNRRSLSGWLLARLPAPLSRRILKWRRHILGPVPVDQPEAVVGPEIEQAAAKLRKAALLESPR